MVTRDRTRCVRGKTIISREGAALGACLLVREVGACDYGL